MDTLKILPNSEEWDEAYEKVERYLISLQIQNRRVISNLVYLILEKASHKVKDSPSLNPTTIAMQVAHKLTSEWCGKVLDTKFTSDYGIPVRGRLAMLLADLPNKWLKYFLNDDPLPKELRDSMKNIYLSAGPEFQKSRMKHRALELTPAGSILAETFKFVNKRPYLFWLLIIIITALLISLFYFTR
ncbi:MAG TPA: hypothetical protein QF753_17850 [Victivallales bacterium]|nr:hypothetical protein [Victivallales bacterium]